MHYPGNNNVYSQPVPTFLCPSDPSVEPGGVVTVDGITWGASSYAGNALASAKNDLTATRPRVDPQGKARIPNDFADGTSNTILHAEKYARCTNTDMAPAFRDGGNAWAYSATPRVRLAAAAHGAPGKAFHPGFAIPALVAASPTPLAPGRSFRSSPRRFWATAIRRGPRRLTPAGCWLAWPTAASALWPPSMSGDIWWAAVTPAGGEVHGSDW